MVMKSLVMLEKLNSTTDKNVESIRVKPKNISDFATVKKWSLKKNY